MHFQWLIKQTEDIFSGFPAQKIELPKPYSKIQHAEYEGVLALENHFYQIATVGEVRIAHTYAPKINIIALFFFPEPCYQLPVYSMEFVMLGEKPIVALMDMVCLLQPASVSEAVKNVMMTAHSQHLVSNHGETLPQWFDECRSGFEFFSRPDHISDFDKLSEINVFLLENLTQLLQAAELYDDHNSLLHKSNLDAYKTHHKVNSPGLRLMNRSFGADWTDYYLTNYLFA